VKKPDTFFVETEKKCFNRKGSREEVVDVVVVVVAVVVRLEQNGGSRWAMIVT